LYQDWAPFLLAIGYVAIEHGVVGVLAPQAVYNHPDAWDNPWKWAAIHAAFVMGASIAGIVAWRLNEISRAHAEQVLESASEGICGLDEAGRITFINPVATRMLGYRDGDLLGKPLQQILQPTNYAGAPLRRDESHVYAALKGEGIHRAADEVWRRKDGSRFPVEYVSTPIRDVSGIAGAIVSFLAITERRAADEKSRHHNATLERRNVERTAELATSNQELEAFSYSVSHDLRAPLRSISGFSEALIEDYADRLDGDGQDMLRRMNAASQRMAQLIDDLLNLSQVTRREMVREQVDLSALARTFAADLQRDDPVRLAEFVIQDEVTAQGDARLRRVVLENLMGNAWRFTARHPTTRT